jgi:hypothetical protein
VRIRFQPWQLAVLLALLCGAFTGGIHLWRTRGGSSPSDLVAYLPTDNATVVYIDAAAIRRAGILKMIAGSKAAEELEYQRFVDQTLFDYRQDLDAVAVAFKDRQVFLAARGNFRWKNLMDYAAQQGGSCHNSFCSVPSSRPSRRISFYPLKSNIMALAISTDDFAAYSVTPAALDAGPGRRVERCRGIAGRHQALRLGAAERRADCVYSGSGIRSSPAIAAGHLPRCRRRVQDADGFSKYDGHAPQMDRA